MQKTSPIILATRLLFVTIALISPFYGVGASFIMAVPMESYFIVSLTAVVALVITYIPDILQQRKIVVLSKKLQEFVAVFTVMAMFFGEILGFYERFVWWDTMLHFSSGIMLSFVGLSLFNSLSKINSDSVQYKSTVAIVFAVLFAITCGAIWEIIEFTGDSLLGMNMQRWQSVTKIVMVDEGITNLSNPGLINTMKDIICDVVGSLCSVPFMLPFKKPSKVNAITSQLLN